GSGPTDGPEDVGGGGLTVERIREGTIAPLELREQPDVLDGDDRLVGEGLQERDLPVAEGADLASPQRDRSDRDPIPHHRDREHRTVARELVDRPSVVRISLYVVNMDGGAVEERAATGGRPVGPEGKHPSPDDLQLSGRNVAVRGQADE